MHADEIAAARAGCLLGLVVEKREIDRAVTEIDPAGVGPVGLADSFQAEARM